MVLEVRPLENDNVVQWRRMKTKTDILYISRSGASDKLPSSSNGFSSKMASFNILSKQMTVNNSEPAMTMD